MLERFQAQKKIGLLKEAVLVLALVAMGVALRFATLSWPNFSPVAGLAIAGGLLLTRSWLALIVPLLTMAISDRWIGSYETPVMMAVYACLAWPALWGRLGQGGLPNRSVVSSAVRGGAWGACGGLISAIVFFVVTNWAHWRFAAVAPESLFDTYVAGLPFLRYTLLGDLLFGSIGTAIAATWWCWRSETASVISPVATDSAR